MGRGGSVTDHLDATPLLCVDCQQHLQHDIREHLHYHAVGMQPTSQNEYLDYGNLGVELLMDAPLARLTHPGVRAEQTLYTNINAAGGLSTKTIKTVQDVLTKQECQDNPPQVEAAMLEELKTWVKHSAFKHNTCQPDQTVLTSRWVIKWKQVQQEDGAWSRNFRVRLCLGIRRWFRFRAWQLRWHRTPSNTD